MTFAHQYSNEGNKLTTATTTTNNDYQQRQLAYGKPNRRNSSLLSHDITDLGIINDSFSSDELIANPRLVVFHIRIAFQQWRLGCRCQNKIHTASVWAGGRLSIGA